ncbi:SRPBCC family protein [Pseudonocardia sp. T1-2H]|uniref:SRPBCC family protein n=1 Tax=Pseudonocardia sp. T1-2H TaxID=3128899 RepID=UPI003100BD24
MGDYEHSTTVATDPDSLFRYLSDVHNLPNYFSAMRDAEPTGKDASDAGHPGAQEIHVVAEVEGKRREGEAWFEADERTRALRWGSESRNGYHGELAVNGAAEGESEVVVSLHTEHADGPAVRAGLEETLAEIKRTVEGTAVEGTANPT